MNLLRVIAQYRSARGKLDLDSVVAPLRAKRPEEALAALDQVLNKQLEVRVFPRREEYRVQTDWFHVLMPEDQNRYLGFVQTLIAARSALLDPAHVDSSDIHRALDRLEDAKEDQAWVEELMRSDEDMFKHGPFTIVLAPHVSRGAAEECISVLDEASAKVRARFPKVLYGKVIVRRDLKPKGSNEPSPHAKGMVAGSYVEQRDFINLSLYATPERNSVMTLIHEFGHRFHTKFLDSDQRKRFQELTEVGDTQTEPFTLNERNQAADEYLTLFRRHREEDYPPPDEVLSEKSQRWTEHFPRDEWKAKVAPLRRKFVDEKDESVADALHAAIAIANMPGTYRVVTNKPSPLYASAYGSTSWTENFAESFLAVCMGKALPEGIQTFMDAL